MNGEQRRRRLLQAASAAAFLALVGLGVAIVLLGSESGSGGDTNLEETGAVNRQLAGIPQHGLVLGQSQAKVTLVEFGDLQCPVCRAFSEGVVPELINSRVRNGEAKLEFRNYTIISQESVPAGAAAIAAGMQGRGWSYLELFYRNQGTEASGYVTDAFMTAIARGAGVPDLARWNKDRHSAAVLAEVKAQTEEAQKLGFDGTPSFAVQGPGSKGLEPAGEAPSLADLEAAIDAAR